MVGKKRFDYETIPPGYYHEAFMTGFGPQRYWHRFKFSYIRSFVLEHGGKRPSMLDIGCGPGTFLQLFSDQEIESALGVDISEKQIAYARESFATPYRTFKVADMVSPQDAVSLKQQFDLVSLIEVIEHFPGSTVRNLLTNAFSLVKKGGILIITTPNYGGLWPFIEWVLNQVSEVQYDEQHLMKFKLETMEQTIREILGDQSFDIIQKRSFLGLAPFISLLGGYVAERLNRWETKWLRRRGNIIFLALRKR